MRAYMLLLLSLLGRASCLQDLIQRVNATAPETFMGTVELAIRDGYRTQTHAVTTADGYVLNVHRIPRSGRPVLLQHGFLSASHLWLLAGPGKSLAYLLADRGYDVWMGNARGNCYSRQHVSLSKDSASFWKFSWHEMGVYDLPAVIDYVLNATGYRRLYYVGHSMGNTMFYVMCSMKPKYNDRVRLAVALSPVAFISKLDARLARLLHPISKISSTLERVRRRELFSSNLHRRAAAYLLCRQGAPTHPLCLKAIFTSYGKDEAGLNKTMLPFYVAHLVEGTSVDTLRHFLQNIQTGEFRMWDYGGDGNMQTYGRGTPPDYDLGRVRTPTVLFYSSGDSILHPTDVQRLSTKLANVRGMYLVREPRFNHIDFIIHVDVTRLLYVRVLDCVARH